MGIEPETSVFFDQKNSTIYQIPYVNKYSFKEKENRYKILYKDFLPFIKTEKEYLYKVFAVFCKENLERIFFFNVSNKVKVYNLENELKNDLLVYFTNLLSLTSEERKNYLEDFSKMLVTKYFSLYPEEDILKPVFNELFIKIHTEYRKELKNPLLSYYFGTFLHAELDIIGSYIKDFVSSENSKKISSIIESTIHILMSSSSDMLGNHLNIIEQEAYLNKRLRINIKEIQANKSCDICNNLNIFNTVKTVDSVGEPLTELIDFYNLQSKMFKSFKNEIRNDCNSEELEFILSFIFLNGFKIKFNHINIELFNRIEKGIVFSLNEYTLVNTIYILLENAIEASAKSIKIFLDSKPDYIEIMVSNDGEQIENEAIPFLFDKCFTTKKNHIGMGLDIAKRWLNNIGYIIDYNSSYEHFFIRIPKGKICQK